MEMSCPSSGPTEDVTFQHFPNPKFLVLSTCHKTSYFDLAFCLGTGPAAGAAFGTEEGLTKLNRLKNLQ